jgi:hypothetical protein
MALFEGVLFHDKRRNLAVYDRIPLDLTSTKSWWHLLKGNSSKIREWTWWFAQIYWSILLPHSFHVIYWMRALPREEKKFEREPKSSVWFYCKGIMIGIIERKLFQDNRMDLAINKGYLSILLGRSPRASIKRVPFHNKRRNLTVYERLPFRFYWHEVVMIFIEG